MRFFVDCDYRWRIQASAATGSGGGSSLGVVVFAVVVTDWVVSEKVILSNSAASWF
jgi:hypothetical protein